MSRPPDPRTVPVYEHVEARRFHEAIRPLQQPALLRGLAGHWPAVEQAGQGDKAILRYLQELAVEGEVDVVVAPPGIEGRLSYTADLSGLNFLRGRSHLGPFFERLLRDRGVARPHSLALQSASVPVLLPGFQQANPLPLAPEAAVPRIWIGNALHVATHADLSENIAVNVAGRRRFTLFPPEAINNLYVGPVEFTPAGPLTSLVDPTRPDFGRFPAFADALAVALVADLEPGDALYIPFYWWHHVQSLDAVNILVNYWWREPAAQRGANPLEATIQVMALMNALPPDQRRAMEAMLRYYALREGVPPAAHIPEAARGVLRDMPG